MPTLITLMMAPALVGIILSTIGYPRVARHPHWQIATVILLLASATTTAGLYIHTEPELSGLVAVCVKTATWCTAILSMTATIMVPISVRTRGERTNTIRHRWHPAATIFEQWQLRHYLIAGASMTIVLAAMTIWSIADPKFNQPVLSILLPALTLVSVLFMLTGWSWFKAVNARETNLSDETPEQVFRLDTTAIMDAQQSNRNSFNRWYDRITLATMATACALCLAIIALSSVGDHDSDGYLKAVGTLLSILLLAGTASAMMALTNGDGHILRPKTWPTPAILQAAGIAAVIASMGLPKVAHPDTAVLLPVGAGAMAIGAGLSMLQRRRREHDESRTHAGT